MATRESSTRTLVLMLAGLAVAGIGGIGLIQGMPTRSLAPWAASCLGVGGVIFLIAIGMLAQGHTDAPPKFCPRCDEVVADKATVCGACGNSLV